MLYGLNLSYARFVVDMEGFLNDPRPLFGSRYLTLISRAQTYAYDANCIWILSIFRLSRRSILKGVLSGARTAVLWNLWLSSSTEIFDGRIVAPTTNVPYRFGYAFNDVFGHSLDSKYWGFQDVSYHASWPRVIGKSLELCSYYIQSILSYVSSNVIAHNFFIKTKPTQGSLKTS